MQPREFDASAYRCIGMAGVVEDQHGLFEIAGHRLVEEARGAGDFLVGQILAERQVATWCGAPEKQSYRRRGDTVGDARSVGSAADNQTRQGSGSKGLHLCLSATT